MTLAVTFSQFQLVTTPDDTSFIVGYMTVNGVQKEIRLPYANVQAITNAVTQANNAATLATNKAAAADTSASAASTSATNAATSAAASASSASAAAGSEAGAATQAALAAIAAQSALGSAYTYTPANAAELAAITGSSGQTALQKDTLHWFKWIGSAWVDQGLSAFFDAMLTSGEIFSSLGTRCQVFNGGVLVRDGSKLLGFSVPVGSGGGSSYVTADVPAASLRGQTVRMVFVYDATASYPLGGSTTASDFATYTAGSTTTALSVTNSSRTQSGTKIVQIGTLVVPTDADYISFITRRVSTAPTVATAQSLQISAVMYQVLAGGTVTQSANDAMLALVLNALLSPLRTSLADAALTLGEMWGTSSFASGTNGAAAGGVRVGTDPNATGVSIPANAGTGQGSYITGWISAAKLVGKTIDVIATYAATSNFLPNTGPSTLVLQVRRGGATVNITSGAPRTITQSGTVITSTTRYTVTSTDTDIGACYQVSGGSVTLATDRSLTLQSIRVKPVPATGDTQSDAVLDAEVDYKVSVAIAALAQLVSAYTTATLQAGPTRTYTTPQAANAAVTAASATARTEIQVDDAYYDGGTNWYLAAYSTLKGFGVNMPEIHFEKPSGDPTPVGNYQPMWVNNSCTIEGIKFTAKNARYAIHAESSNVNPDATVNIRSSWIEHYGNTESGWVSQAAWGSGISSGWKVYSEGNVYRSPFCAFSYHTNLTYARPSYVENRGDVLAGTAADGDVAGLALRIQPLGSGQADQYRAYGCQFDGDIYYHPDPWMPTTLAYQPASHAEVQMAGYGNTPAVFRINDFGRALKIASSGGAGSSVAVSGGAVAVLFGTVSSFAGATNLPGYVYGSFDISGMGVGSSRNVFITSLGKRLGDCTSANKTLTVVVDGGSPVTITFNLDYTSVSNATILASINAALGSSATASEYAIGNRYRPRFVDEERTLQNTSAVGIPMGSVLAYDGSYKRVRLMTSADAPSLFAGVAWEDIYPNGWGRVKTRGYLPLTDVRTSAGSLTFGATMSVGATPGVVDVGGSQGLLRAIRSDAVSVS